MGDRGAAGHGVLPAARQDAAGQAGGQLLPAPPLPGPAVRPARPGLHPPLRQGHRPRRLPGGEVRCCPLLAGGLGGCVFESSRLSLPPFPPPPPSTNQSTLPPHPHTTPKKQQHKQQYDYTLGASAGILLSCALAYCVNLSTYLVIGHTSPVSYQVLGTYVIKIEDQTQRACTDGRWTFRSSMYAPNPPNHRIPIHHDTP